MSTNDRINQEASKDPDTLEREIDQQRAEIGDTLSALEQKFSPGELFDKALGYARGNGGEFMHNLTDTVRANPVPTLLTTVGLAWLMAGQNRQPTLHTSSTGIGSSTGSGASDKARQLKANVSDRMHSTGQHLSESKQRLSDSMHRGSDSARYQADRARQGFDTLLREQPLVLGAIGIAVGALMGGVLPATRREDELMGETSDRLKQRASGMAREQAEHAREAGKEIGRDLKERVDQSGHRVDGQQSTGASPSTGTSAGTTGTTAATGARTSGAGDINRTSPGNGQNPPRTPGSSTTPNPPL